jgi:hypothetical protein
MLSYLLAKKVSAFYHWLWLMPKKFLKEKMKMRFQKVEHLNHLDLHFSFPVFTEKNNSSESKIV